MKKLLAGLALSAALITGGAVATAPAQAAGVYIHIGPHHHHHRRHWRSYYWSGRYWHARYRCWHWSHHHRWRGWCYR